METKKPVAFDGTSKATPMDQDQSISEKSVVTSKLIEPKALAFRQTANPDPPESAQPANPRPAEVNPDDYPELPDKLRRAMRKAVPPERWPGTECGLRRGMYMRKEEAAKAYIERETEAYKAAGRRQTFANVAKA